MDLRSFITETLEQIVGGVMDAQKKTGGDHINAEGQKAGGLITQTVHSTFTRVDFDVAISAETTASGKAALKVFGVGAEAGGDHKAGFANRVTFSVPVRLPEGGAKSKTRFDDDLPPVRGGSAP